jgi:hypothetical protein
VRVNQSIKTTGRAPLWRYSPRLVAPDRDGDSPSAPGRAAMGVIALALQVAAALPSAGVRARSPAVTSPTGQSHVALLDFMYRTAGRS